MLVWELSVLLISGIRAKTHMNAEGLYQTIVPQGGVTKASVEPEWVAALSGAGSERGQSWYDDKPSDETGSSDYDDGEHSSSDIFDSSESNERDKSGRKSRGSSKTTNEKRINERAYRTCTPCPHDMMKTYKNLGIKWICGRYQRAYRTFKSICMMRYRNCQDGTLFLKSSDGRCPNSSKNGRSWFYVYRVDDD